MVNFVDFQCYLFSTSVVPNVGGTAPWGALTMSRGALKGQVGGRGALTRSRGR